MDYNDIVSMFFFVFWDFVSFCYVGLDNFFFGFFEDDGFGIMNVFFGEFFFFYFDMIL